jgi:hypothetical protein
LTDLGWHLNDAAGGLCYPVQLPGEQNDCLQYRLDKEKCSLVEIIRHTRAVERADRGPRIPDDPFAGARTLPALSILLFSGAALAAIVAHRNSENVENVTLWDIAGAFTMMGCAAAIFSEPDQVAQFFEQPVE